MLSFGQSPLFCIREQSSRRNLGQSDVSKSSLYVFLAKQFAFVN